MLSRSPPTSLHPFPALTPSATLGAGSNNKYWYYSELYVPLPPTSSINFLDNKNGSVDREVIWGGARRCESHPTQCMYTHVVDASSNILTNGALSCSRIIPDLPTASCQVITSFSLNGKSPDSPLSRSHKSHSISSNPPIVVLLA